ncbi:MAG: hypothetical protein ACK4SZ_03085 [Allosphingosinicella sp.]|uniref:hypothetical protein n=1 Tax=Allosphingosinicella sp. TaxID=2823234 RepID=UPI003934CD49
MGEIYLSEDVKNAVRAIDVRELETRIDRALMEQRATPLYGLHLSSCGPYVAERLRRFERELEAYCKAKAAKKREETRSRAWSAGSELRWAVRDMLHRIEEEEKERQLIRIDDLISPPFRLSERMEVRIGFQWRRAVDEDWAYGSITFVHDADMRPDYTVPSPRRKPSAAKLEEEREDKLYCRWEHLVQLGLGAVREYLKSGGDGNAIPKTFQAKPDAHSRWLNNFSCDFWRD